MRTFFLLLLVLVAGCRLSPPEWEKTRSRQVGPVTFVTDGDESVLDGAEREWHTLIATVRSSSLAALADCSTPVSAYVFTKRTELDRYAGDENNGLYDRGGRVIYGPPLERRADVHALRHELVHHLHLATCTDAQPGWLVEGLADTLADDAASARLAATVVKIEDSNRTPLAAVEELDLSLHTDYARAQVFVRALLEDPRTRAGFTRFVLENRTPFAHLDDVCRSVGLSPEAVGALFVRERDRLAAMEVDDLPASK